MCSRYHREGVREVSTVYLFVLFVAFFPSGEIANQNYFYIPVDNMEKCEILRGRSIDYGSISAPLPDYLEGKFHISCVVIGE